MKNENVWNSYSAEELEELEKLSKDYRAFMNVGKTERECVAEGVRLAEAAGYRDLKTVIAAGEKLQPGDKVYAVNMKKTMALFVVGSGDMTEGLRILGAHIDSPRLDLKQNPLYGASEQALLDTHYYGGIKKYQWVTIPLALHGVVAKKDGFVVTVRIGEDEDEDDPVFYITDILPHLAQQQMQKSAATVIEGEDLNVLAGSRPMKLDDDDKRDPFAASVLAVLKEKYDIEEADFLSAEIEVVPAGRARDCGFDRSMVMAYGQDDRVCAYPSLRAILDTPMQEKTLCCLLVDKEEIGSVGATGMQSNFFEDAAAELMNACGCFSELNLRRMLRNSCMLSSDVSAAFDPNYSSCFEEKNAAYMGRGLVLNKYTGARGKSGSNDANAEYIAKIRRIFDDNKVAFQTAELGKVDLGGGGTIAYIAALYGMNVIDSGVAVLSMHAPMEIASKADIYEAKKGYEAFLREA